MKETNEREVTLEITLPYEYRIVRYGKSDTLELEALEYDIDFKTKKPTNTKSWKFAGYFSNVRTALKAYTRNVPVKRMVGKHDLASTLEYLHEIDRIADQVSKGWGE